MTQCQCCELQRATLSLYLGLDSGLSNRQLILSLHFILVTLLAALYVAIHKLYKQFQPYDNQDSFEREDQLRRRSGKDLDKLIKISIILSPVSFQRKRQNDALSHNYMSLRH